MSIKFPSQRRRRRRENEIPFTVNSIFNRRLARLFSAAAAKKITSSLSLGLKLYNGGRPSVRQGLSLARFLKWAPYINADFPMISNLRSHLRWEVPYLLVICRYHQRPFIIGYRLNSVNDSGVGQFHEVAPCKIVGSWWLTIHRTKP